MPAGPGLSSPFILVFDVDLPSLFLDFSAGIVLVFDRDADVLCNAPLSALISGRGRVDDP